MPKIQTIWDKQKGRPAQRLIHAHMGLSEVDMVTGKKLKITENSNLADKEREAAFQLYLSKKYNLVNPLDKKRTNGEGRKDIIAREKGDLLDVSKEEGTAGKVRAYLHNQLLAAKTLDDVVRILEKSEIVESINPRNRKSGNAIEVNIKQEYRTEADNYKKLVIRKGDKVKAFNKILDIIDADQEAFDELCKTYTEEHKKRKEEGVKPPEDTPELLGSKSIDELAETNNRAESIYEKFDRKHKDATVEELQKLIWNNLEKHKEEDLRRNKKKTKEDFEQQMRDSLDGIYEDYEKRIKEQKRFYIIYATNITAEMVLGFSIWEKNNQRYLFNKEEGIKIYDKGDSVISNLDEESPEALAKAVALSLSVAESKGWDISKMVLNGSDAYLEECRKQIAAKVRGAEKAVEDLYRPTPKSDTSNPDNPPLESSSSSDEEQDEADEFGRIKPTRFMDDFRPEKDGWVDPRVKYSIEQRRFFMAYKRNIEGFAVEGFNIWEKEGTKYIFNKEEGIRLFDKDTEIQAKVSKHQSLAKAVALSLDVAEVKGWDISKLKLEGSDAYKAEVQRQVDYRLGKTKPEKAPEEKPSGIALKAAKTIADNSRLSKESYALSRAVDLADRLSDKAEALNAQDAIDLAAYHLKSNDSLFFARRGYVLDRNMPDMKYTPEEFLSRRCNLTKAEINDFVDRDEFTRTKEISTESSIEL